MRGQEMTALIPPYQIIMGKHRSGGALPRLDANLMGSSRQVIMLVPFPLQGSSRWIYRLVPAMRFVGVHFSSTQECPFLRQPSGQGQLLESEVHTCSYGRGWRSRTVQALIFNSVSWKTSLKLSQRYPIVIQWYLLP